MAASPAPHPADTGLNTVHLRNGEKIAVADIASVEAGEAVLDDLDASILAIEGQLAGGGLEASRRLRARQALRARKFLRPRVQARIAELRKAERAAAGAAFRVERAAAGAARDYRSRAFVQAAFDLLGKDQCERIYERAREIDPIAFQTETA